MENRFFHFHGGGRSRSSVFTNGLGEANARKIRKKSSKDKHWKLTDGLSAACKNGKHCNCYSTACQCECHPQVEKGNR